MKDGIVLAQLGTASAAEAGKRALQSLSGTVATHAASSRYRLALAASRALAFCLLLLSAWPALAQRIQVEVLVFAYNNPDAGAALAISDADPPYTGMLLGEGGTQYSTLPPGALRLNGANDALARHARTRALLHLGWQQDAGATHTVRLRGGRSIRNNAPDRGALATESPELDGDLNLRFGRGIEVQVDALLRIATQDRAGRPSGEQRFRINSKRVVGYSETHYLDHPAIGVIVRVDSLEPGAE